jgi:hypothetical protein
MSVARTMQRSLGSRSAEFGSFHLRPNKGQSNAMRKISFFALLREIRDEWRANDRANQPMNNNPWDEVEQVSFRSLLKQSPRTHFKILKETIDLYRLTLLDRDESVRLIKIDEEIVRQLRKARSGRAEAASAASGTSSADGAELTNKLAHLETDAVEVVRRVREMFPKDMPTDAASALQAIKARKGDVNDLAVDRLEVMGASISEFMTGYREGKEEAVAHVNGPEGDKYFATLGIDEAGEQSSQAPAAAPAAAATAAAQEEAVAVKPDSKINAAVGSESEAKAPSGVSTGTPS